MDMVHAGFRLNDLLVSRLAQTTFTFASFSCSVWAVALLLAMSMPMNAELVEVLQNFAKGEARNSAFCSRAQKILE